MSGPFSAKEFPSQTYYDYGYFSLVSGHFVLKFGLNLSDRDRILCIHNLRISGIPYIAG